MALHAFIGGIGGPELLIVLFLAVLLFGANKLPQLARSSGEAMGEFQKGRENLQREIEDATAPITDPTTNADARDTDAPTETQRTTAQTETQRTEAQIETATSDSVETDSDT